MKKIFTLLVVVFAPLCAFCTVGETFTVKTENDVEMTFMVTSEGITNTVETGGNWSHCIDWNYEGDIVVPATVTNNNITYTVTRIGHSSFASCAMKSISLPSTITTIDANCICYCRYLQSLVIPAAVEYIGEGAICQNPLTSLIVEAGNKHYVTVDNVLFNKEKTTILQYACDLPATSYVIPSTVNRIADYCFDNSDNLTEVTIPNSVTEIGVWAFHQCDKLATVKIPASVTKIEEGAFTGWNKALKSFEVDESNPNYTAVNGVLYTKDLSTIVCYPVANEWSKYDINDGTSMIFGESFSNSDNLYSIYIPSTVTNIGKCAFFSCNNLQSVDIPSSVIYIGSQAFDYCSNLTKAYFHSVVPPTTDTYASSIFGGNENLVIYVPYTSIKAYRQNKILTKIHIDPAIDWHDNHWYFVFSCVEGIDFSKSQGVKAYKIVKKIDYSPNPSLAKTLTISTRAGESNSPIELVQVDKAGAGDCVLLYAEPGNTYELVSDETAPNITDNLLCGAADDESSVFSTDGNKSNFVFNGTDFVAVSGSEDVALGTGFLQIPTEYIPAGTTSFAVSELPIVSGISSVKADNKTYIYHNLQGVRATPSKKGVYIVNGKKVIMM